jgi:hypothetical protein
LEQPNWEPKGIAMEAKKELGEQPGGLQAPHVIREGDTYLMFYGDCECPFVVERNGRFCLFRNQLYGTNNLNTQYVSADPLNFGVNDDSKCVGTLAVAAPEIIHFEGKYYVAALLPSLKGIRIARLKWVE